MNGLLPDPQAQMQAKMALATGLLQPPSTMPQSFMANIGSSIDRAQGVQQQGIDANLQRLMVPMQLRMMQSQIDRNQAGPSSTDPAAVREFEFYQKLSPEQQQQYLLVKRNQPSIELKEIPQADGSKKTVLFDPTNGSMYELTPSGVRESNTAPTAELPPGSGTGRTPEAEAAAVESATANAAAQAKLEQSAPAAFNSAQAAIDNMQQFADQARRVRQTRGLGAATGASGYIANLPGFAQITGAANANAELTVLKSQSFINALQAMRNASATGGAVGQVSNAEGVRFENAYAALETSQTDEAFKENLQRLEQIATEAVDKIRKAYETEYGSVAGAPTFQSMSSGQTSSGPAIGSVEDGYRFKGGDPGDPNNWEQL